MHGFLSEEELYWLEFSQMPGFGARSLHQLAEHFGSLRQAAAAGEESWRSSGIRIRGLQPDTLSRIAGLLQAQALLRECEAKEIGILTPASKLYPPLLRQIADPPAVLFYRGRAEVLQMPCMAVVGSRNSTTYGLQAARSIAAALSGGGMTIVSGLARGIDRAGHEGAMESGGCTAAVLGCGLDYCYPPEHRVLQERILRQGVILSEFLPQVQAKPAHFPMRNRIISGLCQGVIVVEAGEKSGSLITADMALEQNRDVYCVPGSFFSAANEGGHRLLQQGASLLGGMKDVLRIGGHPGPEDRTEGEQTWLLQKISEFGSTPEELCQATGRSPEAVQQAIAFLRIEGRIRIGPDQRIMKIQEL